jgi:hypothetical protein
VVRDSFRIISARLATKRETEIYEEHGNESEIDELRPEYKRSDFGEFIRGAVTQVEFAERIAL